MQEFPDVYDRRCSHFIRKKGYCGVGITIHIESLRWVLPLNWVDGHNMIFGSKRHKNGITKAYRAMRKNATNVNDFRKTRRRTYSVQWDGDAPTPLICDNILKFVATSRELVGHGGVNKMIASANIEIEFACAR